MTFFEVATLIPLAVGPFPVLGILFKAGRHAERLDRAERDILANAKSFHDWRNSFNETMVRIQLDIARLVAIAEETRRAAG